MDPLEKRRWLVIPASIINTIDFGEVIEASPATLRYNVAKDKTFVKYDVNVIETSYEVIVPNPQTGATSGYTVQAGTYGRPSFYNTQYPEYTHAEMLALLETAPWKAQNIPTN
jgi:hypothetical protein